MLVTAPSWPVAVTGGGWVRTGWHAAPHAVDELVPSVLVLAGLAARKSSVVIVRFRSVEVTVCVVRLILQVSLHSIRSVLSVIAGSVSKLFRSDGNFLHSNHLSTTLVIVSLRVRKWM